MQAVSHRPSSPMLFISSHIYIFYALMPVFLPLEYMSDQSKFKLIYYSVPQSLDIGALIKVWWEYSRQLEFYIN